LDDCSSLISSSTVMRQPRKSPSLCAEIFGKTEGAVVLSTKVHGSGALSNRRGSALTAVGRAQRLARQCGGAVSPALREATEPLPLTPREREVITLVAQGMSNRQIANEMRMSIRTVEGHLYRAAQRSGTTNRNELAALIREFAREA